MEYLVFILGGVFYGFTEILYRGYTHWSMVLTGGAVAFTFYMMVPFLSTMNVFAAAFLGAVIITFYEFSMGVVVNLWFQMDVWDYSALPGNIMGQICPKYSAYWFLICLAFFSLIKYNRIIFF